jgi:hypothetical protein
MGGGDARALAGPLAGVSFLAGVLAAATTAKAPYPRPGTPPEVVRAYFVGSAGSARLSVVGQLLSCAALALFTTSVADVAERAGRDSGGLRTAATVGGGFAAATLATSALASAVLTREQPDLARVRALHDLVFLAGGPVHNVGLGLFTGALGLAGLRTGVLPRPLCRACVVFATVGILSPLSLAAKPAMVVIPLARFPALVLDGIAGGWLFFRR